MKTIFKQTGFLLALALWPMLLPQTVAAQQNEVSMQVFYDELSPYGEWVDYPQYGYVWIPDAGADFVPYSTRGQWIYTDYGWTWMSDYEWGWAPFHYGRWDYDTYYGWLWVPDYDWGPSWVTWRRAGGYYGWQPMRPGININYSFGNDYYNNYSDNWIFVRNRDFQKPNVSRYHVNPTRRNQIIRNSTVINNTYIDHQRNTTYISGPNRQEVQQVTRKNIRSFTVQESSRPGQSLNNDQLRIYRPQVRNTNNQGRKPAPSKITNSEDVKRYPVRNTNNQQRSISPAGNSSRDVQPNNVKRENTKIYEQPTRQRLNENSPTNKSEQPQNQVSPRNNTENKTRQEATPVENKEKEKPREVVTPPNDRMQAEPAQPRLRQTEPVKQELQQKTTPPPNTKRSRRQSRTSNVKTDQP